MPRPFGRGTSIEASTTYSPALNVAHAACIRSTCPAVNMYMQESCV
jgi:hypothetical protein